MKGVENIYQMEENVSSNGMNFFFISKGKADIVKIVQYLYVQDLNGTKVYNLGFGDYDLERILFLMTSIQIMEMCIKYLILC